MSGKLIANRYYKYIFSGVCFAAFTFADPFGFASVTSQASQQLTYRVLSLFQSGLGAEHTAVLLVDDRSAREINGDSGYPLAFAQHATALRPVICAGPAALFIDITFRGVRGPAAPEADIDPQSSIHPLLEGLRLRPRADDEYCRLPDPARFHPASEPRIMIGRTESHPKDKCDPLYGRLLGDECRAGKVIDRLREVALPVSVGTVRDDGAYLLASQRPGAEIGAPLEPSPALAMVFAFCDAARGSEREKLPGCRDRLALEALLDAGTAENRRQLVPRWSFYRTPARIADKARFSPQEKPGGQRSCSEMQDRIDASILSKLSLASYEIWQSLFHFGHGGEDRVFGSSMCVPTDTFSLLDIRQMASYCGMEGDICRERLATFFAGRMVFYGVDITGINDLVETPVAGLVPGAAYHAAVAEDLLTMGSRFSHLPGDLVEGRGFRLNLGQIVDILVFIAVASVLAIVSRSSAASAPAATAPRVNWPALFVYLLFSIAAITSLYLAFLAGLPVFTLVVAAVALAMLAYGGQQFAFNRAIGLGRAAGISRALLIALGVAITLAILADAFLLWPPTNIIATAMFAGALAFDE